MVNHEFNAIGWAATKQGGGFMRSHSAKNANQHAEFLGEIGENSPAHRDAHACWHDASREALMPFWTKGAISQKKGSWRATDTDQLHIRLSKYSSKAQKSICRRASIFPTRMGIGGRRFDCVGGIKTQQRFERPPLGWTDGRMKYPTRSSQRTTDITGASRYSLVIIGSRTGRELRRRMPRASILVSLRKAICRRADGQANAS
jgi:hypothetical protein